MKIKNILSVLFAGLFNPIALRKAKIVHNFGLSECNRIKLYGNTALFFLNFSEGYIFTSS